MTITIPGNLLTTAIAAMPHTDVVRALEMALSLEGPFWPQLPNFSCYEDMYVQAAEHFPGIILDVENFSSGAALSSGVSCPRVSKPSPKRRSPLWSGASKAFGKSFGPRASTGNTSSPAACFPPPRAAW